MKKGGLRWIVRLGLRLDWIGIGMRIAIEGDECP
jgi:hypothetical protein